jgi:Tfp pilus assembly protein PilF
VPLYDRLLTQLRAWVHYIFTLFLPLNLNVDYDFSISRSLLEGQVLLAVGVLILAIGLIWKVSFTHRSYGFFALWFGITLLPTNSVFPLEDVVTDRWLHLPSVGFAMIMALFTQWIYGTIVEKGSRQRKMIFFFSCALVLELYGHATLLRNFTWHNEWMLWEDAVIKSPNKDRPHNGLGLALMRAGKYEEAILEFQRVLELNPKHGGAYLNLGITYLRQGKFEEAIQALKKSMALSPRLTPEIYTNLGVIYGKQGRVEEAIHAYQKAIEARPHNSAAYYNLGDIYAKQGDVDRAISCFEGAVKFTPEFYKAHYYLAGLYEKKGWREKSQEANAKALKFIPSAQHLPEDIVY